MRHVSMTDPDASIVAQGTKPKLSYKTHRTVDAAREVIRDIGPPGHKALLSNSPERPDPMGSSPYFPW